MKNMPKKSPSYGFVLAFFVLALPVVLAHAQSVPSQLNTGYPENGLFHGSEIDNVQINNGGLHVAIPVSTTKGRGLSASSKVVYNSKSWTFRTRCFTSGGGFCEDDVRVILSDIQLSPFSALSIINFQSSTPRVRQDSTCNIQRPAATRCGNLTVASTTLRPTQP
jgi:hypothetical protein